MRSSTSDSLGCNQPLQLHKFFLAQASMKVPDDNSGGAPNYLCKITFLITMYTNIHDSVIDVNFGLFFKQIESLYIIVKN